jgi:predicted negative regulator of RcsB-dependent stress response
MATPLDLQEQEQLDALKAFWKTHGNLITWLLIAVLGAYAAWNAWGIYQRDQGLKASAMFDELDRAAQAGDAEKAGRIFADLKSRFSGTAFTDHGALAAAQVQFDKGAVDAAKASLTWLAEAGAEEELRTVARLRLAGILLEAKQFDDALKQLSLAKGDDFAALVADRRGDILAAQGKSDEAKAAFQTAYKAMEERVEYRRLIEAKLTALGAAPAASAASAASGAAP